MGLSSTRSVKLLASIRAGLASSRPSEVIGSTEIAFISLLALPIGFISLRKLPIGFISLRLTVIGFSASSS